LPAKQHHTKASKPAVAVTDIPYRYSRLPSVCLERRLISALKTVAALLIEDEGYLPIFLRLEKELEALKQTSSAVNRAQEFLKGAA
jgi:hypothetical protein